MKIRYGGDLQPGDFVIIACGTYTDMGWYIGEGKGTLQYYSVNTPQLIYKQYQKWQADPNNVHWGAETFSKGLGIKSLWKAYIHGSGLSAKASRVVKITEPESIFTEQEDLEAYQLSKEVLNNFKFPAK